MLLGLKDCVSRNILMFCVWLWQIRSVSCSPPPQKDNDSKHRNHLHTVIIYIYPGALLLAAVRVLQSESYATNNVTWAWQKHVSHWHDKAIKCFSLHRNRNQCGDLGPPCQSLWSMTFLNTQSCEDMDVFKLLLSDVTVDNDLPLRVSCLNSAIEYSSQNSLYPQTSRLWFRPLQRSLAASWVVGLSVGHKG